MCKNTLTSLLSYQVTEKVQVFVMDANDDKPQFQNMPAIVDVLEVSFQPLIFP